MMTSRRLLIALMLLTVANLSGIPSANARSDTVSAKPQLLVAGKQGEYMLTGRWYHCWEEEQASELPEGVTNPAYSTSPTDSARAETGYTRIHRDGFMLHRFYVQHILVFKRRGNSYQVYRRSDRGICPQDKPTGFASSDKFRKSTLQFDVLTKAKLVEWGVVAMPAANAFNDGSKPALPVQRPADLPMAPAVTHLSTYYASEPKYKGDLFLYVDDTVTPVKLYLGGSNYGNRLWVVPWVKF